MRDRRQQEQPRQLEHDQAKQARACQCRSTVQKQAKHSVTAEYVSIENQSKEVSAVGTCLVFLVQSYSLALPSPESFLRVKSLPPGPCTYLAPSAPLKPAPPLTSSCYAHNHTPRRSHSHLSQPAHNPPLAHTLFASHTYGPPVPSTPRRFTHPNFPDSALLTPVHTRSPHTPRPPHPA